MKCLRLFFATLCALLISVNTQAESASIESKQTIGAILPLSGAQAYFGKQCRNGIELALSERSPSDRAKIDLIFEDDQLQPAKSVTAFNKLVSIDKVRGVLVFSSGVGNAVGAVAEEKKVISIAIGASDKHVTQGKKYSFAHWVAPENEAKLEVEEVLRQGYKKIGLVYTEQEGVLSFIKIFKAGIDSKGQATQINYDQSFAPDTHDFRSVVARLKSEKVDGVLLGLFPGSLSSFVLQAKQYGLSADIFGWELFEDWDEVKAAQGGLLGRWYVGPDDPTDDFASRYKVRFGESPGITSGNAYDSTNILIDALLKNPNNPQLAAASISALKDYSGATGHYSATGDNRFELPAAVKIVTKDGFKKRV